MPLPDRYNMLDWYFYVGGDKTRAYYSGGGVNDYVPVEEQALAAFLAAGGVPQPHDTEFNLGYFLGQLPLDTHEPVPLGVRDGFYARKEEDQALWLNHEDRIRVIEAQLGITSPPPLPAAAERIGALKAALERKRDQHGS